MKNFYEILEVDKNASKEIIDKAYRVLAKKYHPDANSDDKKDWAEDNFKQINEAYETLSNPTKREAYNQEIESEYSESFVSKDMYNALLAENQQLKNELNSNYQNTSNTNYSDTNSANDDIYDAIFNNPDTNQDINNHINNNNVNNYYQDQNVQQQYYYKKPTIIQRILNTDTKRTIFAIVIAIICFELLCRLLLLNPKFKSLILTKYYTSPASKFIIQILNNLLFKPLNLT